MVLAALAGVGSSCETCPEDALYQRVTCRPTNSTIYQFNATTVTGDKNVSFDEFKGKAMLIFNVATY